ncbi:MAG: hypothetical protein IIC35_03165 [Gemmatimonadetes bacterium]|nr:hypothetical protein [Gemmatimonadota bacterium]
MLVDTRRRSLIRLTWTMVLGLTLGGLLTKLSELFLPESAARDFLVPVSLGPISVTLNVLTLVGISIVALIGRSWM